MSITASVTSQPIAATVSETQIDVAVPQSATIAAAVSGGSDAITAADIGAAASSHTHAAGDITSGTIATARLGSGTASASTFLRGDGAWATPSGGGSSSASDLTSGTLDESRLSFVPIHPFLLMGG